MFELDKYDSRLQSDRPATPDSDYEPASNVALISLLFWGEHCVECAAPACYQTCDLYAPREDKRCRRFAAGALKNRNFKSMRGYGVEISFKKWAKIEAYGNTSLSPKGSVLWIERFARWAAPVINACGRLMGRLARNANWDSATYIATEKLVRFLNRKQTANLQPDAFLLEVYNPTEETVRMQLNFEPTKDGKTELIQLGPSFVTTVALPKGYSRHEIGFALFRSVIESAKPFKISLIPEADNNARLIFLTVDLVQFTKQPALATETKTIKCVVWDLDNTLWNGILVEGDSVKILPETVGLLEKLDERGILLSIASKNDHSFAWEKLKESGISEYFLFPQINWVPKSANIKTIAERLNIGLDAFAFIDDNPFELDQVRRALPEVTCINANTMADLLHDSRFQGSASADSRQRRQFYREAMGREAAQQEFGSNYLGFLASCGIKLEIATYTEKDSERVAELVQRTNQLNFSGHKYTRNQLGDILANPQLDKYVIKSSDKYGSYGTVGFSIVEQGAKIIQVRDFMLSCRVQGKFIEQAFFNHLMEHHNPLGVTTLWVNFQPTARNKPAQQVLESLNFRKCNPAADRLLDGMAHSSPDSLRCNFIQVECSSVSSALRPPVTTERKDLASRQ